MLEKALARRDEIYNELKAKPDPRLAWEFQVVYWQGVQVGTAETYDEALRKTANHLFVEEGSQIQLDGVNEYMEYYPVNLINNERGRLVIKAFNEGGYNSTEVDLIQLLEWILKNRPDLL